MLLVSNSHNKSSNDGIACSLGKKKKAVTNLDSILRSKDVTLLTKVCLVQGMVFSSSHVWM